jgi:proline iminopeptidase
MSTSSHCPIATFTIRALAALVAALPYTGCARSSVSSPGAERAAPFDRDGYVDAGNGVRLFYRFVGSGRDTVVVLHGGPGFSMSYIAADLEPLARRHTLLFYDQRGAGRSTVVTDSASLDARRFGEDLEVVRRRFSLERLTLLAHSWGAGVAALYASRYPERVGRLVVIDGIPTRRALQTQGFQRLDARRDSSTKQRVQAMRAARLANPGDAAACRAYYDLWFVATYGDTASAHRSRGDFCAGSPEAVANKIGSIERFTVPSLGDWDWRPSLRAVTAPALVIHGTGDFIPLESAREWTAALPGARLLLLEGSGHFPYVEQPERFFTVVEEFLAGRWPAGAQTGSVPGHQRNARPSHSVSK